LGLLESALAQPEASFAGAWLHKDHYEMAAAYAYHLCQNHPFIDGNKRTALAAALVFLELNGISILDPRGRLKNAMVRIASGRMSKSGLRQAFEKIASCNLNFGMPSSAAKNFASESLRLSSFPDTNSAVGQG
jgi:death on curing protein